MKSIQSKWLFVLLIILFITLVGQIVIHWEANMKLVLFNGVCAFILGVMIIMIRKRFHNR
ncbi:hypothetical protein [Bacillus sp. 1P02SD]|uniref:hypothetical protein n=1 Tax=Bacillus sp. 1P02SD TaxID=3132264 RepID=UPI0039A26644